MRLVLFLIFLILVMPSIVAAQYPQGTSVPNSTSNGRQSIVIEEKFAPKKRAVEKSSNISITLPSSVYFDVDAVVVEYETKKTIAAIALSIPKSSRVVLTAFSNSMSSDFAAKERMALNRAIAVKQAMIAEGVSPNSISINPVEIISGALYEERAVRRVDINLN